MKRIIGNALPREDEGIEEQLIGWLALLLYKLNILWLFQSSLKDKL